MTRTAFQKMHGLGNDFVILDARTVPVEMTAVRAAALANRHSGIGCDQLILLEASSRAAVKMRIFNADGSEVAACGNATRCVAALLGGEGLPNSSIETAAGLLHAMTDGQDATVDMGAPRFGWDDIPLGYAMDTAAMPVAWDGLATPMAVNVGNPHVVFFVKDLDAVALGDVGPLIEHDPLFPERVNVNVAQVTGPTALKLMVWERGVGLTQACGTGACATAVAAIRQGKVQSPVTVSLPGGNLEISWTLGEPIQMRGPATFVFEGEIDWANFP